MHCAHYALYSLCTVLTVHCTTTNDSERLIMMLLMGFAGLVYAYIIGSVCNIVSNMDLATKLYEQSMDHLNSYMQVCSPSPTYY
jgi:hypothetical protein